MKPTVVLVEGTWGGAWAQDGSPFRQLLEAQGFEVLRFQGWTESVDGVPNVFENGHHADWIAGGRALGYFTKDLPYEALNFIGHSHGGQVCLYRAADASAPPIRRLITVCTPVRDDMRLVAMLAAKRIDRWRHVASNDGDVMQLLGDVRSGSFDFMQLFGELGDGQLGLKREWHLPGVTNVDNVRIPGIGHTKLLNDPRFLDLWKTDGLLDFLKG